MNKEFKGAQELSGRLSMPPDKSISHRVAMFAAIADGESRIDHYSQAADPQSTLSCLRQLGVDLSHERGTVVIRGTGRNGLRAAMDDLDCGNSGTTMRLLSGILVGAGIDAKLAGDASLSSRTMKRIIDPLRQMGGDISGRDGDFAPLVIRGRRGVTGMRYTLPVASAQLKSAVLLAGLFGEQQTEVIETLPSRDHTERLLNLPSEAFGSGKIIQSSLSHAIPLQTCRVPGDFSSAAFWLVAGSVHPNAEIVLENTGLNPSRVAAMQILQEMGADIEVDESPNSGREPYGNITVRSSSLRSIKLDPALIPNCIDELPVLMVAMCFAEGRSEISGASELRHKETDRLGAMANLLKAAGEQFDLGDDGIVIQGRGAHRPQTAHFESEHDHRIAMSAAVMGVMADGVSAVRNAECTAISYPTFWDHLQKLSH